MIVKLTENAELCEKTDKAAKAPHPIPSSISAQKGADMVIEEILKKIFIHI